MNKLTPLTILLIATLLPQFTLAESKKYYRVTNVADNDTLSVRKNPSAKAKKIGELYSYDTGIMIQKCKQVKQSTWCKIELIEDTIFYQRELFSGGWVNKHYLTPANNNITLNTNIYFKVSNLDPNDELTVREHPGATSNDAYSLKADAKCHLAVRCQNIKKSNWCYIVYATYGMKTEMHENKLRIPVLGWVNSKYLQKDNDPFCETIDNPFYNLSFSGES